MQAATDQTARKIADNWQRVCEQVAEACHEASRPPASVRIVGVSKYVGPELAAQLVLAGCRVLGENRPQSLWEKYAYFQAAALDGAEVQFHLIGHLQRNKIRRTLPMLTHLHSLDSLRLAESISQLASQVGLHLPVLAEVNVTGDASKTGLPAADLQGFIEQLAKLPGLNLCGLMAMSSLGARSEEARREFEQVRHLRDSVEQCLGGQVRLPELSMGMSGDFREAIAAGATLLRIGSNLWQGVIDS